MTRQHSFIRGDEIHLGLWLVFTAEGGARMTRGQPDLSRHERALSLSVVLPKAMFRTPSLSAKLVIDAPEQPTPTIDLRAASEALKAVIGCDVQITVNQEGE